MDEGKSVPVGSSSVPVGTTVSVGSSSVVVVSSVGRPSVAESSVVTAPESAVSVGNPESVGNPVSVGSSDGYALGPLVSTTEVSGSPVTAALWAAGDGGPAGGEG